MIDIFHVLSLLPKREVRVMEELNRMANQIRREREEANERSRESFPGTTTQGDGK